MTIIISDELKNAIQEYIKKGRSWKEKTYNFIDKLMKNDSYDKSSLSNLYEYYIDKNSYIYSILDYKGSTSDITNSFQKQLSESLTNLFKTQRKSDFISTLDKKIINDYAFSLNSNMVYRNSGNKEVKTNLANKLSNKIGNQAFDAWEQEHSIENLTTILSEIANDAVVKYDTHRYSDETVDCFLKATIAPDVDEAISVCQYALHEIDINGVGEQALTSEL